MSGAVSTGIAALIVACYSPTSVTLKITTDIPCRPELRAPLTDIYIGPSLASAEDVGGTRACTPSQTPPTNDIGTLTIVPKGSREDYVIAQILVTTDGAGSRKCISEPEMPKSCIVARRKFRYVAHEARTLPIRIDSRCAGVRCKLETDTCIDGVCVDATVPDDADSPAPTAPRDGEAPDGPVANDAGDDVNPGDATTDGPAAQACRGLGDGTLFASVDGGADLLAVNGRDVFWVPTSSAPMIYAVPKTGTAGPITPFYTLGPGSLPKAVAADDNYVWLATSLGLLRFDATNLAAAPTSIVGTRAVEDIALANGLLYYLVVDGGTTLLGNVDPVAGALDRFVVPPGSKRLAVGDLRIWTLDPSNDRAYRFDPAAPAGPTSFAVPFTAVALAAFRGEGMLPEAAFVTRRDVPAGPTRLVTRLDATAAPSLGLAEVATTNFAGAMATAGTTVFVVNNTPDAAVVTRFSVAPPFVANPSAPVEPTRYAEVKGLAVDPSPGGCVYFTARPRAAGITTFALRSAPKASPVASSDF
ncbi:MAG: hypothetical protein JST00_36115 [Deltaproteobacteria bacterium]|nr:hypothetical protein [Deltaproteobacteria bacterium]